jgi:hypothetical protein
MVDQPVLIASVYTQWSVTLHQNRSPISTFGVSGPTFFCVYILYVKHYYEKLVIWLFNIPRTCCVPVCGARIQPPPRQEPVKFDCTHLRQPTARKLQDHNNGPNYHKGYDKRMGVLRSYSAYYDSPLRQPCYSTVILP